MTFSANLVSKPGCEIETLLSDGRPVCLRPICPSDEPLIYKGIVELSDRSRYLRFFSAFREPPEVVVKRLSAVDGHNHIGWGAILLDDRDNPPIAAAHAIRSNDDPSSGELAIAVLDNYQRLGLARTLIAVLLNDCVKNNLHRLEMQIMSENRGATNLARALGAEQREDPGSVAYYVLNSEDALQRLTNNKVTQMLLKRCA